MTLVVQIALGIVLGFCTLAILLASKHVRITFIVATILAIPIVLVDKVTPLPYESIYTLIGGVFVMVGVVALGLSIFESLPAWFIKLLESSFWILCVGLFAGILIYSPIDDDASWWMMMIFLAISLLMLFKSLRALKQSFLER